MNQEYLNELYSAGLTLADIAAKISKRYFKTQFVIDSKTGNYPVTVADYEIEKTIRSWLLEHYPNHNIIGEELPDQLSNSEYTWVIDPIDGTVAFSTGKPTFTTLISVLKCNKPIIGIIDQPILNERYIGIQDKGAWLNQNNLSTSEINCINQARLNATTPFMFNQSEYGLFNKLAKNVKLCAWGGDAYAYAALASGHIDIIMESDLKYYDVAALIPIIESSGGIITTWNGSPITSDFSGQCLASANLELHDLALKIINN